MTVVVNAGIPPATLRELTSEREASAAANLQGGAGDDGTGASPGPTPAAPPAPPVTFEDHEAFYVGAAELIAEETGATPSPKKLRLVAMLTYPAAVKYGSDPMQAAMRIPYAAEVCLGLGILLLLKETGVIGRKPEPIEEPAAGSKRPARGDPQP